ncbi:MAG: hypothetical protein JRH20_28885 [Deltaproteobacteria bacterium]|nr:hypothetical protein [Deltaproteobacteria bacterium]
MAISGLVITLSEQESERVSALNAMEQEPWLSLGVAQGHRLPVVVDSEDRHQFQACWDALLAMEGVVHVDLVTVDYE